MKDKIKKNILLVNNGFYFSVFIFLFLLMLLGFFLAWPIVITDTDLWYHLSGGRYFWQNWEIASNAFFSYVDPPKFWYNYYWLFQVIIFKIFELTDYYGLIALRCLLYFLAALFIYLSFVRQSDNQTEKFLGLFFFISCSILILQRELIIRPHLFSYLFIVVFLYILEFKRDKIWALPLLGIVWSNIHGIEFPVMFLIVFAYLAEIYWQKYRKRTAWNLVSRKEKWLLISVLYSIFATPGIIKLVQIPFSVSFQSSAYQHLYVAELLPTPFRDFFIYAPVSIQGIISLLQNLIVLMVAVFLIMSIWKKKLRISHAILFLGAIVLLAEHRRFTYEFTLLSIPLLRCGVQMIAVGIELPRRFVNVALPIVVVMLPFLIFNGILGNRPKYPFSSTNLPVGNVRFLNLHFPNGGRILNDPNTGGFLPWALRSNFKIYMDMQMSLFSDLDFATALNAFYDEQVFKSFIDKYNPSFISASLKRPEFKKVVVADKRFVPVFFDNAEVLYINNTHYPELVEKYALKFIDPFRYQQVKYEEIGADMQVEMLSEASRTQKEDQSNYGANYIMASIYLAQEKFDLALFHAETLISYYPELSYGYSLKGDVFFGLKRYDASAALYEKALDMGQTSKNQNVYWNLYASYVKLNEYKKAYKILSQYVNPFNPYADYKEIYQLGISAASVGKTREAVTFLKIAKMKAPPADMEYVEKIERNLAIQSGDLKE